METDEELFAKFEATGEAAVRLNAEAGRYGEHRGVIAREWLRQKAQAREDAAKAAEMELARRATEAAESAAQSAREANRIAKEARNISYGAGVIALLALAVTVLNLVFARTP